MAEIKRISEQNEISIRELRVENKRKLQEKEEYFNDELKKNALVMKDQNELIQSFEEKIEKSLQHQKKIEEKYLSQLNQAKEVLSFSIVYSKIYKFKGKKVHGGKNIRYSSKI